MAFTTKSDSFIEVRRYRTGSVAGAAAAAVFLQAFLPKYIPHAELLELPLLVAVYFSMWRRNAIWGIALGGGLGLVQDAVSNLPLGVYGIALTVVGYISTWVGGRIDVDLPLSRFGLVLLLYDLEQAIIGLIRRFLLEQPPPFLTRYWLAGSVLAAILAMAIYPQLDHLQKP